MKIEQDRSENRFVAHLEHGDAALGYAEAEGQVLNLDHTFVPPEHRGEGIARQLVEHAFAYAEENGWRIRPNCPYVRTWLERNPGRRSLVVQDV